MLADDPWPLTCPVCDRDLERLPNALACSAGHSFDIAREGYVNLLTARDSERGITGDTAGMLRARRRFLDTGAYAPLRDAVREEVERALAESGIGSGCVVEAGCGDGYYIGQLAAEHPAPAGLVHYIGFDISKAAVRLAARRYRAATFAVANIRSRLYVQPGSASVVLSICAPRNVGEFGRMLDARGCVLVVLPSEAHLETLRAAYNLLGIEDAKEQRVVAQFTGFEPVSRRSIEFPLCLNAEQVRDLIVMGPNAWHEVASAAEPRGIETLASFVILRFERLKERSR